MDEDDASDEQDPMTKLSRSTRASPRPRRQQQRHTQGRSMLRPPTQVNGPCCATLAFTRTPMGHLWLASYPPGLATRLGRLSRRPLNWFWCTRDRWVRRGESAQHDQQVCRIAPGLTRTHSALPLWWHLLLRLQHWLMEPDTLKSQLEFCCEDKGARH